MSLRSGQAGKVTDPDLISRRLDRLRHELRDEGVALPDDAIVASLLLRALDYARHPQFHEGVAPRFGAIIATTRVAVAEELGLASVIDCGEQELDVVRRLADGRSSFVVLTVSGGVDLACFDRTVEYEAAAVQLADDLGVIILQRLGNGWVRICSPDGVATWDGVQWWNMLHSVEVALAVHRWVPDTDLAIIEHIVEFCIHWLGAGRVGALLTWCLEGDPHDIAHAGFGAAVEIPPLDVRRREHFSPLLNALAQYDRAALVERNGVVRTVGVALRPNPESVRAVEPYRGTRHTSAQRFSFAEPTTISFVVSSGGPLSVFHRGQRLDLGPS
jgi:hypothetical protein